MKKFLLVLMSLPIYVFAGQTAFYYDSTPGDWVGQGEKVLITPLSPATFSLSKNYDEGVTVVVDTHDYMPINDPNAFWWRVNFSAPNNVPLTVGSYENATRFPFQDLSEPGLSMSGSGRGCNKLSGRFDILEIEYDAAGENILKFAADFEQHCELFMPPLFGNIRYNSDIPLGVLIPGQIKLINPLNSDNCIEASGPNGALVELNGLSTEQYSMMSWSTSTGLTGSGPSFSFDVGLDMDATVTLTLSDQNGSSESTIRSLCVSDTTAPTITILSPLDGETFVSKSTLLKVKITDAVDSSISTYEVFLGNTFSGELVDGYSSLKLENDSNVEPVTTDITVKASDASGNTANATVQVVQMHDNREK